MNELRFLWYMAAAASVLVNEFAMAEPQKSAQPTATDPATETRELFRKGLAAYNNGQVEEAEKLYLQAWVTRPSADVAMELAHSEMVLGKYAEAAEHLEYAIRNFTPSINEKMRNIARQAYADVVKNVAKLNVSVDQEGAEVLVNGRVVGKTPLTGPVYANAGQCLVEARAAGASVTQTLYVETGKEFSANLALQSAPKSEHTSSPPPSQPPVASPPKAFEQPPVRNRSIVPVIIGGAVFAAGIGTAVGFKLDESSKNDDAVKWRTAVGSNGCGAGSTRSSECAAISSDSKSSDRDRALTVTGLAVAGVAATATALYWFWPKPHSTNANRAAPLKVGAWTAPGMGIATISGVF